MPTPPTSFHLFPNFTAKLRDHILELTIEPRIVETVDWMVKRLRMMRHLRSYTQVPAQLQTCHEAREHLNTHANDIYRFEKTSSGITTKTWDGFDPVPEDYPERERYVWFNFDSDMLSIGDTDLHEFLAVAYQIRRLRPRRNLDDEHFPRAESFLIGRRFRNVVEVHLICLWGIKLGYVMTEDTYFHCRPEKVYFTHPEAIGWMVINGDAIVAREHEELDRLAEEEADWGSFILRLR